MMSLFCKRGGREGGREGERERERERKTHRGWRLGLPPLWVRGPVLSPLFYITVSNLLLLSMHARTCVESIRSKCSQVANPVIFKVLKFLPRIGAILRDHVYDLY